LTPFKSAQNVVKIEALKKYSIPVHRGENESIKNTTLPCESPRHETHVGTPIINVLRFREGRTRVTII